MAKERSQVKKGKMGGEHKWDVLASTIGAFTCEFEKGGRRGVNTGVNVVGEGNKREKILVRVMAELSQVAAGPGRAVRKGRVMRWAAGVSEVKEVGHKVGREWKNAVGRRLAGEVGQTSAGQSAAEWGWHQGREGRQRIGAGDKGKGGGCRERSERGAERKGRSGRQGGGDEIRGQVGEKGVVSKIVCKSIEIVVGVRGEGVRGIIGVVVHAGGGVGSEKKGGRKQEGEHGWPGGLPIVAESRFEKLLCLMRSLRAFNPARGTGELSRGTD